MNFNSIKSPSLLFCLFFLTGEAAAVSQSMAADPVLINHERIAYWLKQRNELEQDASDDAINAAVTQYINDHNKNYQPSTTTKRLPLRVVPPVSKVKSVQVSALAKASVTSDVKVNVLVLLIDFPDLPYNNNRLIAANTDMFYNTYSPLHYNEMLFSSSGYSGPDDYIGDNLLSVAQYFDQESGNSFRFEGNVFGWYTASKNASYYGSGDEGNVAELVLEAVNAAVAEGTVSLADYDLEDPDDFDDDGNYWEPDGVVDHIMVFHSSIGEEAGGGVLGTDAIWSQRFVVGSSPQSVVGSSLKVEGFTIVPIDAAAGVVAHEFGHDLGLLDEYDTNNSTVGSPVGNWSIMAAGTWMGEISGTEPVTFSPLARDYLQTAYGGNWINQQQFNASDLTQAPTEIELVEAVNHTSGINQVKVNLAPQSQAFKTPYHGSYQYFSKHQNSSTSELSFTVALAANTTSTLRMQAQWELELNYDYVQVMVNGQPLAANQYTSIGTGDLAGQQHILTGSSTSNQWRTLTFDLSVYAGQQVTITIKHVTDFAVGGFGFVVDNINIVSASNQVFFAGAESNDSASNDISLNGFDIIGSSYLRDSQAYYIQLRSHHELDRSLAREHYSPGILMWLSDSNYSDNQVEEHPGHGMLAVIDADQNFITGGDSLKQVADAAFGLYQQLTRSKDNSIDNVAVFLDTADYSNSKQPESGVILSPVGFKMEVVEQALDSNTATVWLSRIESEIPEVQTPEVETPATDTSDINTLQPETSSGGTSSLWGLIALFLILGTRQLGLLTNRDIR